MRVEGIALTLIQLVEYSAVALNLLFLVLLMREKIACWPVGIAASLLFIWVWIDARLYSEAVLHTYYVVVGFFGWWRWSARRTEGPLRIRTWGWTPHLVALAIGVLGTLALGTFFARTTDAAQSYADALSTIFSFVATYMEAQKILSTWIFWIAINAFSVWLYAGRGKEAAAGMMVAYALLSVLGWRMWTKSHRKQLSGGSSQA